MGDQADAVRGRARQDPVVLACCLAWSVPVVVAVVRAVASGWYPVGDQALIAVRAHDVLTGHHPLLGTAASAALGEGVLTNHPGPLIFDVVALPVRVFGPGTGLVIGIAGINLAAGLVAIVAGFRQGGRGGALAMTAGLCALVWSAGNAVLIDPYNPTACMVAFFAVLALAWATVDGDRWALPWLIGLGTFCVQTNLAYLVTTVPIVVLALGSYVWRRRRHRPGRDLLRRGVPVLVVLWAQPIVEQLAHVSDGNAARLARASRQLEPPLGLADGTRRAASVLSRWPGWARGNFDGSYAMSPFVPGPSLGPAVLSLVALIAVLVLLAFVGARWLGDRATATLPAAAAAFVVIGWVATVRVPLSPVYGFLPHFVRWLWPIGVMAAVAIGVFAGRTAQRWRSRSPRPSPVIAAAVPLFAAVAIAVPDGPATLGEQEWGVARPVAKELNRLAVERLPASGVVVDFRPSDYPPFAFSLVAALQEHGTPFFVVDELSARQFGDGRAADPSEHRPVVSIVSGFEALDAWDQDPVACAAQLDAVERERLAAARDALIEALGGPGFTLSEDGARFATTTAAPPWLRDVEAGVPGDVAGSVRLNDLVALLDGAALVPPPELRTASSDLSTLGRRIDDTAACIVLVA